MCIRDRDLIMDGLKKISDGELQYKIKTDTLTGKQKVMAEYINNIEMCIRDRYDRLLNFPE